MTKSSDHEHGLRRPRARNRQTRAPERRAQVIAAAMRVISRDGMAKATTRAIAKEARAPLAALHYVFASKDELVRAVIEEATQPLRVVGREIDLSRGAAGVMRSYATLHWELVAVPQFEQAQLEIMLWALRSEGQAELATLIYGRWIEFFDSLFRAADPARSSGLADESRALARTYLAILDGVTLQYMTDGDMQLAQAHLDALIDMLVRAHESPSAPWKTFRRLAQVAS